MIFSWKKWLSLKHLCENTACTPDVHLDIILLPREHNLRRAVVSCGDIASHLGILNTGKTKIANFEIAVLIDKDITRFKIAMDDASGVDVLQSSL
jgi:hypothetical protein